MIEALRIFITALGLVYLVLLIWDFIDWLRGKNNLVYQSLSYYYRFMVCGQVQESTNWKNMLDDYMMNDGALKDIEISCKF